MRAAFSLHAATVSRVLALATLVLIPIPYGSVDTAWIIAWGALLSASLLLAGMWPLGRDAGLLLGAAAFTALSWSGVLVLQQSSGAAPANAVWAAASALLQHPLTPRVAATAQHPLVVLGPSLLFFLAIVRFILLGAEPGYARVTLRLFAAGTLVIGLLSFAAFIADPTLLVGRRRIYYIGNFTGPFINRNTAATFFGTATIAWVSSFMERLRTVSWVGRPRSGVALAVSLLDRLSGGLVATGLAAVMCLGWTAVTASRAGFVLTLVSVTVVGLISALRNERWRARRRVTILLLVAVVMPAALVAMFGGLVGARIASGGLVDVYRFEVYRIGLAMIGEHPWLGIGLGNFEAVFPGYRTPAMGMFGVWERAHSTPIEIAIEMGVPLSLLLGASWLAVGAVLARNCFRPGDREVSLAAFGIYLLGTLHSAVDFSLQIPGYAVVFAALVAVGLARPRGTDDVDRQHRVGKTGRPPGQGANAADNPRRLL